MPAALPHNTDPRAKLVALRAARGYVSWAQFYRDTGLAEPTALRWLSGITVRSHFVEAFARALGLSTSGLCALRDQIVEAERREAQR